jgi:benzoate-CoA ligase family protein
MITIPERYNASLVVDQNLRAGRADRTAIYYGEERITYGELAHRIGGFGRVLAAVGMRKGERVLLVLSDTPWFPIAFFAVMRAGGIPVPVDTTLQVDDYRFLVEDSQAVAMVVDPEHLDKVQRSIKGYARPVRLIATDGEVPGAHSLTELLGSADDGEMTPANTRGDDAAFWLYSSGSTGKPKAVVHRHRDLLYTCESYARHVLKLDETDTTFSAAKAFHAYGLGNSISFPFWAGASTVLYRSTLTPQAIFGAIQRYRPTLFFSVPTLYSAMLNHPGAAGYDLSSIRLCVSAAEALPAGVWRGWKDTFGLTILDGLGSTEMLHIFVSNTTEALKPGSSGKPVPGYEVRILDEEGRPVEPGKVGWLYVRGGSTAACYWRNRQETETTVKGGWVDSGDFYRVDEDGFYWYEGRADDMIKVSSLWVSPIEVESTITDHPAVSEAAVVGVPVGGLTRIKAFVVLREGFEASQRLADDLQGWCQRQLKRYKRPYSLEFVQELPKTATGKVRRRMLRRPEYVADTQQPEDNPAVASL